MKKSTYFAFHSITLISKMRKATDINDGVTATVLAGAVCETFLNDMYRWFQHGVNYKANASAEELKPIHPLRRNKFTFDLSFFRTTTQLEEELASLLNELEKKENKSSTAKKYAQIIKLLKGTNELGTTRFQELSCLFKIRNDIVHSKGITIEIPFNQDGIELAPQPEDYPEFLKLLFDKGILVPANYHDTWLYLLDTEKYCEWVKSTVVNSVYYVLENLDLGSQMSKYFEEPFYVYEPKSG